MNPWAIRSRLRLLSTPAAGARPGALSGRVGAKTRRVGRSETTRRLANARIVASELRSAAARTDSPAWQTERHTADDSAHQPGQRAWTRPAAGGGRTGAGPGLFRRRGNSASAGSGRTGASAGRDNRTRRAVTVRTPSASDNPVRWAARPRGGAMNAHTAGVLEAATIRQQCKVLHLPTVASQSPNCRRSSASAPYSPASFLEALLAAELEGR